jgi:crotonobetainyl-CoA:carnitine CoA-transferase CaiB-like acyl-CoA transferase
MRPLAGIRVLDFSTLLPGPMATLLLAEAGAEVIKVEQPGGEMMRHYVPRWGKDSVNFALLNRGKKSVTADLKDPQARHRILDIAKDVDVVVEQFRPGAMGRLGLGYDELRKLNHKLIYCTITGYGQTGPRRDRAGHDLNYIGDAGLLGLSSGTRGHRVVPPALIADIAGGAYPAVMNILFALRQRDVTGEGAFLDIAMADNLFPFMYWAIGNGLGVGNWPDDGRELVTGGSPRYHLYDTRDGAVVAAAPLEQKFWIAFTQAIGLERSYIDDGKDPAATTARVAAIIADRTAAEWRPIFDAADCCCSIVQNVRAALDDPHFIARGLFAHALVNEEGTKIAALPVPIASVFRAATEQAASAPSLSAHNTEFDL